MAPRHGIAESVGYNGRAAKKAALQTEADSIGAIAFFQWERSRFARGCDWRSVDQDSGDAAIIGIASARSRRGEPSWCHAADQSTGRKIGDPTRVVHVRVAGRTVLDGRRVGHAQLDPGRGAEPVRMSILVRPGDLPGAAFGKNSADEPDAAI